MLCCTLTLGSQIDVTASSFPSVPGWMSHQQTDYILCAEIFHFPELGPGLAACCDRWLSTTNPDARVLAVSHTKRRVSWAQPTRPLSGPCF